MVPVLGLHTIPGTEVCTIEITCNLQHDAEICEHMNILKKKAGDRNAVESHLFLSDTSSLINMEFELTHLLKAKTGTIKPHIFFTSTPHTDARSFVNQSIVIRILQSRHKKQKQSQRTKTDPKTDCLISL
jgi:hypothetical protein